MKNIVLITKLVDKFAIKQRLINEKGRKRWWEGDRDASGLLPLCLGIIPDGAQGTLGAKD